MAVLSQCHKAFCYLCICMVMDILTLIAECNLLYITVQISHCQEAGVEIHCLVQQRIIL